MIRKHLHRLGHLIEAAGGPDIIWNQIAGGSKMREIMEPFVNPDTGKPYDKSLLYQWIHRDPEREKAWKEARRRSAYVKADEAGEILDDLADDARTSRSIGGLPASEITLARQRIGYLQWLAGISNEEFKDKNGPEVNINLGQLHLEALQAGAKPVELPAIDITDAGHLIPAVTEVEEAEVEWVEEPGSEFNFTEANPSERE